MPYMYDINDEKEITGWKIGPDGYDLDERLKGRLPQLLDDQGHPRFRLVNERTGEIEEIQR